VNVCNVVKGVMVETEAEVEGDKVMGSAPETSTLVATGSLEMTGGAPDTAKLVDSGSLEVIGGAPDTTCDVVDVGSPKQVESMVPSRKVVTTDQS
jgi:hypothetical protein